MDVLTFGYILMFKPGYEDENPIGPTEAPLNLIMVARSTGPTMAVVWDYETQEWTFQPGVAAAVLYANPERHRTRRVDRETAEREVTRFATKPLPTEEELTAICRAGRPG
jgi:hypothetical protein